ncbi:MAG: hypothetical protein A2583_07365 [Bdellovibrionales bacterium RIFOXYD1_FULL_53_11]|nr:MAG: hypothetical protein A2583_07365 [Bdellovibrionales bacterium RIFOXYD1_FULL_53_11]
MIDRKILFDAASAIRDMALNLLNPKPDVVAIFGSFASNSLHSDSDIDLLFVGDSIPRKPYDRSKWIIPLIDEWRRIQPERFPTLPRVVSPMILSKEGIINSTGLRLSMCNQSLILFDSGLLSSLLNEASEWIRAGEWKRRNLPHGGWAWIPKRDVA